MMMDELDSYWRELMRTTGVEVPPIQTWVDARTVVCRIKELVAVQEENTVVMRRGT